MLVHGNHPYSLVAHYMARRTRRIRWLLAKRKIKTGKSDSTSATVGYEAQIWQMAVALRGNMDTAAYRHFALGRLFLKYISDSFDQKYATLPRTHARQSVSTSSYG
jgi:type I restriction enzyme M protein